MFTTPKASSFRDVTAWRHLCSGPFQKDPGATSGRAQHPSWTAWESLWAQHLLQEPHVTSSAEPSWLPPADSFSQCAWMSACLPGLHGWVYLTSPPNISPSHLCIPRTEPYHCLINICGMSLFLWVSSSLLWMSQVSDDQKCVWSFQTPESLSLQNYLGSQ